MFPYFTGAEVIIPYQELLGNYNLSSALPFVFVIIPYQELLGNYNYVNAYQDALTIIPYQELLGNYNAGEKTLKPR